MGWSSDRYQTGTAVVAIHAALLLWLESRPLDRPVPVLPTSAFELIQIQPLRHEAPVSAVAPLRLDFVQTLKASGPVPVMTLEAASAPQSGLAIGGIHWDEEARRAARESSMKAENQPRAATGAPTVDFFPKPKHHRGEEIGGLGGETLVFISDRCYQIVPAIAPVATAGNNGMANPTYCLGDANEPRGDLFKELDAYKKLHPDPSL